MSDSTSGKMALDRDPFDEALEDDSTDSESEVERRQRQLRRSYQEVLDTESGRRVLWHILSMTGLYRPSFNIDTCVMSFNEGSRNIGLKLLDSITGVDPNAFIKMMDEARNGN